MLEHGSGLKQMGFLQTTGDPCLYTAAEGEPLIIAVYVDDILPAGKSEDQLCKVKKTLSSRFSVKDMGVLSYFLGVNICQDPENGKIWLGQPTYCKSVLERMKQRVFKLLSIVV